MESSIAPSGIQESACSGREEGVCLALLPGNGRLLNSVLDRRTCPGRYFALRTLFLNIACTLAVFDISVPVGEKLEAKYHEGVVRYVLIPGPLPSESGILFGADARCKAPPPVQVRDQTSLRREFEVGQRCGCDG